MLRTSRPAHGVPRRLPARALPIARGLLLGLPIAAIFAVLFASADPIFRGVLEDALGFPVDLGDMPGRIVFVRLGLAGCRHPVGFGEWHSRPGCCLAWCCSGNAGETSTRPLGGQETVIILLLVDVVFGAFVAFQLAYLFVGLDTLTAVGMTYSDYARRGFFELVAAACLAGGLPGCPRDRERVSAAAPT